MSIYCAVLKKNSTQVYALTRFRCVANVSAHLGITEETGVTSALGPSYVPPFQRRRAHADVTGHPMHAWRRQISIRLLRLYRRRCAHPSVFYHHRACVAPCVRMQHYHCRSLSFSIG